MQLVLLVAAVAWVVLCAQDDHQKKVEDGECKEPSKGTDNTLVVPAVAVVRVLLAVCVQRCTSKESRRLVSSKVAESAREDSSLLTLRTTAQPQAETHFLSPRWSGR